VSEPVELIDAGEDDGVAVIRISGRTKLCGVETDLTYAALYTFRDGKVARGREYWTQEEALEAAGFPLAGVRHKCVPELNSLRVEDDFGAPSPLAVRGELCRSDSRSTWARPTSSRKGDLGA
jgi:hypothetical protein